MGGHAQHDDQEYADPEELKKWKAKDPIAVFRDRLLAEGFATSEELVSLVDGAFEEARVAADQALAEPAPLGPETLEDVYTDVVARPPWTRMAVPDPRNS
jgi:pyruvate dehydrogenase E1 component alpha subunit